MEWQVVYNGSAEVPNIKLEEGVTKPDLSDEAVQALRDIRKHHKLSQPMTVSVTQACLCGSPSDPSQPQLYQPIGKMVFVKPHTEGSIKKMHFFVFIATAEGSRLGAPNAKYICHVFKCKNESDAHALAFAAARTIASNVQRKTSLASGSEDRESSVTSWNASNPPLYHFTIGKDKTVSGNVRIMCQVDKTLKTVSKVVRLTNLIRGDELIKLLAEKFNLGNINISDYAVFDIRDNGDQNMLEDDDSPINVALTWSDPCEGTFFLKRLPQGLVRVSKASSRPDSEVSSDTASHRDARPSEPDGSNHLTPYMNGSEEEESALGPLLPYHPDDEDLLLSVMITKQDGRNLGFKLTPSYLLQMCVAYCALKQGSSALRRLLTKIASAIDDSIRSRPDNPDLLLFWAANSLKLMSSLLQDPGVFAVFSDCAKPTMDAAISFSLDRITACVEEGKGAPAELQHANWNTAAELRALVVDHYRALDQNMSHESLREVVHRITAAMPSPQPQDDGKAPQQQQQQQRRPTGGIPQEALEAQSFESAEEEWQRFKQSRGTSSDAGPGTPLADTTTRLGFSSSSPGSAPMTSTPSGPRPDSPGLSPDVTATSGGARQQSDSQYDNIDDEELQGSQGEEEEEELDPSEPLPEEWEELMDQETNHRFFANHLTRQTSWTDPRDKLVTVKLVKGGKGLGLGITGAKRSRDNRLIVGIFVSSLVPGSAADVDGTLREGDEILEVNGHSLIGVSREGAIDFLKQVRYGDTVTLLVAQEAGAGKSKARLKHTAL